MARYSKKAGTEVKKAMHEKKKGTLKSGRSGKKVTSRKQAIAIGLSKARKAGAKIVRRQHRVHPIGVAVLKILDFDFAGLCQKSPLPLV